MLSGGLAAIEERGDSLPQHIIDLHLDIHALRQLVVDADLPRFIGNPMLELYRWRLKNRGRRAGDAQLRQARIVVA